jgi:hypothetical protein
LTDIGALQDILALKVDDCRFGNWKLETGIWKPELDKGEDAEGNGVAKGCS